MKTRLSAAALGLLAMLQARAAAAAEPAADCGPTITRASLVRCALDASLVLREATASRRAAEGRVEAVRPLFPSNPMLSGTFASRAGPAEQRLNWSLGLSQELEVGGQRGLRLDVSGGELRAQVLHLASARTSVLAEAWVAWFEALAANERSKLAAELEAATRDVASTVRAMTAGGLSSELDTDLADAAALRASHQRLKAQEEVAIAQAGLQLMLGGTATSASGELEPLAQAAGLIAPRAERPEVLALREAQAALQARVGLLQRTRVPNPTVSLFAQNDGFDERVLGVGVSLPIPVARPLVGEVAEAAALAERAEAETERVRRELQVELDVAVARYEAAAKGRALYTAERVSRTAERLESIAAHVRAARLPVRDALVAQQVLMEQLKAAIDAREALCVASVRLTRAAGLSLEGETP